MLGLFGMDLSEMIFAVWVISAFFSLLMMFLVGPIYFKNKENGYIENVNDGGFATFIAMMFGPVYFAVKKIWGLVFLYIMFLAPTIRYIDIMSHSSKNVDILVATSFFAISLSVWTLVPFFATYLIKTDFLRKGWVQVNKDGTEINQSTNQ